MAAMKSCFGPRVGVLSNFANARNAHPRYAIQRARGATCFAARSATPSRSVVQEKQAKRMKSCQRLRFTDACGGSSKIYRTLCVRWVMVRMRSRRAHVNQAHWHNIGTLWCKFGEARSKSNRSRPTNVDVGHGFALRLAEIDRCRTKFGRNLPISGRSRTTSCRILSELVQLWSKTDPWSSPRKVKYSKIRFGPKWVASARAALCKRRSGPISSRSCAAFAARPKSSPFRVFGRKASLANERGVFSDLPPWASHPDMARGQGRACVSVPMGLKASDCNRPMFIETGPHLAKVGASRPKSQVRGRFRSNSSRNRSDSPQMLSNRSESGPDSTGFDRLRRTC